MDYRGEILFWEDGVRRFLGSTYSFRHHYVRNPQDLHGEGGTLAPMATRFAGAVHFLTSASYTMNVVFVGLAWGRLARVPNRSWGRWDGTFFAGADRFSYIAIHFAK